MMRRLRTIAVFLLLGAIVNITAAWICAFTVLRYDDSGLLMPPEVEMKRHDVQQTMPYFLAHHPFSEVIAFTPEESSTHESGLSLRHHYFTALDQAEAPASDQGFTQFVMMRTESGFPFYALCGIQWTRMDVSPVNLPMGRRPVLPRQPVHIDFGLPVKSRTFRAGSMLICAPALLPLKPVWPGFMLNTALYGTGIWLLITACGILRRGHRRRRGRCPHCGYDLRGRSRGTEHDRCPECGKTS